MQSRKKIKTRKHTKLLGHCANDENEPRLFRYKEECEDACLGNREEIVESTTVQHSDDKTYATVGGTNDVVEQTGTLKQVLEVN